MLIHTVPDLDLTLFYFDKYGSYNDLLVSLKQYIDRGPTRDELFFFDNDAPLITPMQVRNVVPVAREAVGRRPAGSRTALLFCRDALYGLGRVYKVAENRILRRPWTTRLFKNLDDAVDWLNIDAETIYELIRTHNQTTSDASRVRTMLSQ